MTYMKKYKKNNFQIVGSPSTVFYDEEYIPNQSDIELRIPVVHENDVVQEYEIKKLNPASNCYYYALWKLRLYRLRLYSVRAMD